jgi:predicted AAA+ superfamily ATPase
MTGSNGRKLKRGASNLLAGRAFVYHLHPLTSIELGESFDLDAVLSWGALPKIQGYFSHEDKEQFLRAYAHTYLREEIVAEQLVRNLNPFRQFLEVAAQANGKIVNYAKIAEDVGVDGKTIQSYFSILEDTLVGILLPPFHRSIRKRQRKNPKFYFFDTGVTRALARMLSVKLEPHTYAFGNAFEHFIITEIMRLSDYARNDWSFSYLHTNAGVEIDLVIERPGKTVALVEIKSTTQIRERDLSALASIKNDIQSSTAYCLSLDPHPKIINGINCCFWREGIAAIGL